MTSQAELQNLDTIEEFASDAANSMENLNHAVVAVDSLHHTGTDSSIDSSGFTSPTIGMEFTSAEEAYRFYLQYAFQTGFGVVKNGGGLQNRDRKPRLILKCHKHGKPHQSTSRPVNEKNRLVVKTGCQACVTVLFESAKSLWVVSKAVIEHNHELCPEYAHKLPCFRELKDYVKKMLQVNDNAGVPVIGNINAVTQMGGGEEYCGFTERDVRNFIGKIRRLNLQKGDCKALMKYFKDTQSADPNLFYALKFDEENRLERVFWSDSVSRSAYQYFGDVVSFDTTYIVNK